MTSDLLIVPTDPFRPEAMALVEQMWDELSLIYVKNQGPCLFKPEDVQGPRSVFLVAWLAGLPVGCAAVRPLQEERTATGGKSPTGEIGEVKRVFVKNDVRGRRIGRRLMEQIAKEARRLGYGMLRLETGILQADAIRLYRRIGYQTCTCWGHYAGDPESICFELRLTGE